jgi:chromosome segregation ATPase
MTTTIATREAVTKAYHDLKEQGRFPSIPNIISYLGGGSKTTIAPILRELREADERYKTDAYKSHGTLDQTHLGTFSHIIAYTVEKAEENFQSDMVSALETSLEVKNKEIAEMTQLIREMKAELKTSRQRNEELKESNDRLLSRLESMEKSVAKLLERQNLAQPG